MSALRLGSLCTGYGGLDAAVGQVLDVETVWHTDPDPGAAAILVHHWPAVPNLGDITTTDWASVPPVDVLTAGFPCQDVSLAGRRAGIADGTRSGLWTHVARAIETLRPRLVVLENVRGLLSASAHSDVEPCTWCVGDAGGEPPLRALGAVLGDLARLGFDAQWASVRASDVGAPHQRERVFLLAWPADARRAGLEARREGWPGADAVQDADLAARGERRFPAPGQAEGGRARPDAGGRGRAPAAAPPSDGRQQGRPEPAREQRGSDASFGSGAAPADSVEPDCLTCGCPQSFHDGGGFCAGCGDCADPDLGRPDETPAHPDGDALRQQPVRQPERSDPPIAGLAGAEAPAHANYRPDGSMPDREPHEPETHHHDHEQHAPGRFLDWGDYAAAIRRWEHVTGRLAPAPTEPGRTGNPRLSAAFVEWLMGLPAGHVTGVPGLTRTQQLRALGNGVVPAQGAAAVRLLLERAGLYAPLEVAA